MCCIVKMHLACRNIIVLCKVLWWLNATQINPWMKMWEIHSVSASFYVSVATQILFNNLLEQHLYLKFLYYKVNWCTKFRVMTKVPSDLEQTWEKNKLSVTLIMVNERVFNKGLEIQAQFFSHAKWRLVFFIEVQYFKSVNSNLDGKYCVIMYWIVRFQTFLHFYVKWRLVFFLGVQNFESVNSNSDWKYFVVMYWIVRFQIFLYFECQ